MARPPHIPTDKTRAEVSALVSFGIEQHAIADYLGITFKTLAKHYKQEIKTAKPRAHAEVAKFLFSGASGRALKTGATYSDCLRAAMFWAKTQMGWRENQGVDDGSMSEPTPVKIQVSVVDSSIRDKPKA